MTSGVLVIIGLMSAVFFVLLRRGRFQPVHRAFNAVSVKYRQSMVGHRGLDVGSCTSLLRLQFQF